MQRPAVVLARVLGFVEIGELIAGKSVFLPDMVQGLVERYKFQKFPQTIEELDFSKGVEFLMGRSRTRAILKFVIYETVLVLETKSNTTHSIEALRDILNWAQEKFDLNFSGNPIARYAYISDITFYSDAPLLRLHPAVERLTARTTEALTEIWQHSVEYHPAQLRISHDPMDRKNGIAPFSIERRAESRFYENKYYSEAPLPTDLHLQLIEQYEKDILAERQKN